MFDIRREIWDSVSNSNDVTDVKQIHCTGNSHSNQHAASSIVTAFAKTCLVSYTCELQRCRESNVLWFFAPNSLPEQRSIPPSHVWMVKIMVYCATPFHPSVLIFAIQFILSRLWMQTVVSSIVERSEILSASYKPHFEVFAPLMISSRHGFWQLGFCIGGSGLSHLTLCSKVHSPHLETSSNLSSYLCREEAFNSSCGNQCETSGDNSSESGVTERTEISLSDRICAALVDQGVINSRQSRICRRDSGLPEALVEAYRNAYLQCKKHFRYERWNCTEPAGRRAMLTTGLLPLIHSSAFLL